MKILLVDSAVSGHHIDYFSQLSISSDYEVLLALPQKIDTLGVKQYLCKNKLPTNKRLKDYIKWLKEIRDLAKTEKVDIVHFLYGDVFYRFFGYGLRMFKEFRTVMTMHWMKDSRIGMLSTKALSSKVDALVVHSDYIKEKFSEKRIGNVCHIEYPQFHSKEIDKTIAKKFWNIGDDIPVILCFGNTRYDKGLDILLDSLENVKSSFRLFVCGKTVSFKKDYIEAKTEKYRERVTLSLSYITDEEMEYAFAASDIVALPYRKIFNGASGPLGEGVSKGKIIVGPNHGVLGYTIEKYHLGYTFESENVESLADSLDKALQNDFKFDKEYLVYRELLKVHHFKKSYLDLYVSLNR